MQASRRFLMGVFALTLIWSGVLVADVVPQIRGDYGWRWPYELPTDWGRVLPFALALIVYTIGAQALFTRKAWQLLVWTTVGGVVLTLTALYLITPRLEFTLFARTISPITTGWHYVGAEMDDRGADHILSTWAERMEEYHLYSAHVAISPPGMAVGYYGASEALEQSPTLADKLGQPLRAQVCHEYRFMGDSNAELASAWLGMLMPLWTALTVIPLFWFGKKYFSEGAARWSIMWWALLPSVIIFTPYPSVIFPILSLPVVITLLHGLLQNRIGWMILAGFLMSLLMFMSFSVLPLIFFCGVVTLGIHWLKRAEYPRWWSVWMGVGYGVGLVIFWLGYYLIFGEGVWEMFQASMNAHLDLQRAYLPWVFLHLYDYLLFIGFPLVGLAILGLVYFRQKRLLNVGVVIGMSVTITVLVLDISGVGRGETGRVWMFLTPFVLLMAGYWLDQTQEQRWGWWATGFQALMTFAIALVIHPIGTGISAPPNPSQPTTASTTQFISNGSTFADTITLQQFSGHLETRTDADGNPQTILVVWVDWESQGQVDVPYYLSFLPVAPDGSTGEPLLTQPFNEQFPMTCWLPKVGMIQDRYEIPISNPMEGDWWVSVAILDRDGNRLGVVNPDGSKDVQVGIGPFREAE